MLVVFDSLITRSLFPFLAVYGFFLMAHPHGVVAQGLEDFSMRYHLAHEESGMLHQFDVEDRRNRVLIFEESTDLSTWTVIERVKITNTVALLDFLPDTDRPGVFFRFRYEDDEQVPNEVATVLNLPENHYNYANISLPAHLQVAAVQNIDNTPQDNPITNAGATLGRVLFYDRRLSLSNTVSCASCHQQDKGFSDGLAFSVGFEGGRTGRNSMGLAMSRFYNRGAFFWDERAPTLEAQSTQPVQDPVEMGSTFPEVATEIGAEPYYQTLFASAFPDDPNVNEANIQKALAQFVRSMVSYQSKYDEGVAVNFANFTAEEELGRQIFFNDPPRGRGSINCAACHATDVFVQPAPRNIGLDAVTTDRGFGAVSGQAADDGKFKVGSLRNIELTAPYMHDGRFSTLEEVVRFYSTEIQDHPNLDGRLTTQGGDGPPRAPNYTDAEVAAQVAFMKTLTDSHFTADPRWSDPFDYLNSPSANFSAAFLTDPVLPEWSEVDSIFVGGLPATILTYDDTTGLVDLYFDSVSLAPGFYNALLSYTSSGGSTVSVYSANQFEVSGGVDPTFATTFATSPQLPLLNEIISVTVGGVEASIVSYDPSTGELALLFDETALADGSHSIVMTYLPSGGTQSTVSAQRDFTIGVPEPENILLLILDDWAIDRSPIDNTVPPGEALPSMPNLQALADDGLRFTRAYVNPVCSPTRASIITGRYAHQTGVYEPGNAISMDELALPEAFTLAGSQYAMAMTGKWHLGGGNSGYSDLGGWDEIYGITGGGVGDYFSWSKNTNGTTANSTTYTTTDQVNEALAFIDRSESAGDPWFCWVAFNAPHSPFHDPPAGLAPVGGYSPQVTGETTTEWNYRKMLEALDTELGRLLAGVDPGRTNVILIGDNGTPNQVVQAPFGNGHSKGDLYNGGIHVPMVVRGPAVGVTPGSTTDRLVHAVDLYSTILELAGISPGSVAPPTALAQSKSILPILDGTDTADRWMVAEGGIGANRGRAIIVDDYPAYKLIIFNDPQNPGIPVLEFYNVGAPTNDINEQTPLNIGSLTGTALDAYNACVARDAQLGGGFLSP